ncbi:hypothetical protein QE363_002039 [Sphingomonas sp. SORGH_AS870]|nr:hypothetical protein [Sphingomonas sp. SORGH_AS_0870]
MLPIALRPDDFFAQDSQATSAFHLDPAMPLTGKETIGIGTTTGNAVAVIGAGRGYDLQDATTEVVTFVPHDAIGP